MLDLYVNFQVVMLLDLCVNFQVGMLMVKFY